MYRNETENVEVYFICYKKEEMSLVETYYDEILDIHYWYFNAQLAYLHWKNNFKNMPLGELTKMLLTVAASRYVLYVIENKIYKSKKEYKKLIKDLSKIDPIIKNFIKENEIIQKL